MQLVHSPKRAYACDSTFATGGTSEQFAKTESPVLARLTDSQFAVFLGNLSEPEDSSRLAQSFLDVLAVHFSRSD
ncbi:MAG: hypothetical protein HC801_09910 [Nitrospira sp.]|nr:hypothetical protein [Nitrospira sp.]